MNQQSKHEHNRGEKFRGLRGKKELSTTEWYFIAYETAAIYSNHYTGPSHGGTLSSQNFKIAKTLLDLLKSGINAPPHVFWTLSDFIRQTEQVLSAAKIGLRRHNAQADRIATYSLRTGECLRVRTGTLERNQWAH